MLRFIMEKAIDELKAGQFQYISCYGLSLHNVNIIVIINNFNTSHVTVYQPYMIPDGVRAIDFNTSHVTVYLGQIGK